MEKDAVDETLGLYGHLPTGKDFRPETLQRSSGITSSTSGGIPYCLEVFSGSGNLSAALKATGLPVLPDIEIQKGSEFDLLRKSTQTVLLRLLSTGKIKYVHFGTPCRVFSRARHNLQNYKQARLHETEGVALALFTVRCIRVMLRVGGYFSIENPLTSRLWDFEPVRELFRHRDSRFIRWDMCGFSTSYKKPTALLTNMPNLSGLARTCTRDHQHAVLRGSESRWVGGELKRGTKASFAGEYPMSLCTTWASLVSETLGSSSHSSRASRSMAHGFKTALHEAVHCSHRKVCQHARGADKSSNTQKTDPTLTEATAYIREKGVVFGQHTNAEVQSLKQGKDKQVTFQS